MDLTQNKEKIKEFQERAKELVAQMTLEEKVSQMVHGAAAVDRLGIVVASSAEGDYFRGAVGSTLDVRNIKVTNE